MTTPEESLMRNINGRDMTVFMSEAMEHRVRAFMDRANKGGLEDDPVNPDNDDDVSIALAALVDRGLWADEGEHGLESRPSGDLVSIEQMNELRRQRQQREGDT